MQIGAGHKKRFLIREYDSVHYKIAENTIVTIEKPKVEEKPSIAI